MYRNGQGFSMLLAVDVGNTNTKIALCPSGSDTVVETWRVSTHSDRTADEWFALLHSLHLGTGHDLAAVSAVVLSSVVPATGRWFATMCRDRLGLEPTVLRSDADLGMLVCTDVPAETGIDRVVTALGARARYGAPVVVVDCGTATKVDAVDADGAFLGGAIAPGLALSLEALASRAARLFPVELVVPDRAIGTNTVASVQAGVVLGYLSLCDGLIGRVVAELGGEPTVVATGGHGRLVADALPTIEAHHPTLTIEGILAAYRHVVGRS